MKDFVGHDLNVGDMVVLIKPNYRQFVMGKINRIVEGKVGNPTCVILYEIYKGYMAELRQYPGQLVKVEGIDATAYVLRNK